MKTTQTIFTLRSGSTDLVSYLTMICDRIEQKEPNFRTLVPGTYDRKRILDEATKLLKKYPDPSTRPPLFGVPVGIKDILDVSGFQTRCGTSLPSELFDGPEASCVTKLRLAGSIIIGKTVTTEFAYCEPGPTRNPVNPAHTPGGSSSGSAAGIAAKFFSYALGTQTAGSTIRPAAYCGVVGFKPSYNRISTSGAIPFSPSADHIGVFCSDLTGVPVIMGLLAHNWSQSANIKGSSEVVLGIPEGPFLDQASDNGLRQFNKNAKKLALAGYKIKSLRTFENISDINEAHRKLIAGELARIHTFWFRKYRNKYRERTLQLIERGQEVSEETLRALRLRQGQLRHKIQDLMDSEGIDYWICPSAVDHAPQGLENTGSPLMNFPWTFAGLPCLTLPAGLDDHNLPHGVQFVGRYLSDEILLKNCEELEAFLTESPG